jgi:hypothetical protein
MAHRAEWLMQVEVARLFATWLPSDAFWTATDATTTSPTTGLMRRMRGCKAGLPDFLILYRGTLIAIELKSPQGRCTPSQRAVREALLRAGADWVESRSANAVMQAVREAGVPFNMITHSDGTIECWRQPELAPWEVPRRDPAERRPSAPEVAEERRASQRRWRERQQRARETSNDAPLSPSAGVASRQAQRRA